MNLLSLFKPIRYFVFDLDGVLTDGSLQMLPDGDLSRKMNIRDGYALQQAIRKGYRVVVISGSKSGSTVQRLNSLGITAIFMEIANKKDCLEKYISANHWQADAILYMGDDIPDYEAMKIAGLPVCPADAVPEIKSICQYISPVNGGQGCVREVIEKVLKLNGHWFPA